VAAPFSIIREPKTAAQSPRSKAQPSGAGSPSVLAVAVQEHDDVQPVLDCQCMGRFLVAAIAKILGMTDDMGRRAVRAGGPLTAEIEGVTVAGVVYDHLGESAAETQRDPVERREQRRAAL
jgi:hypothetical protein